MSIRDDLAQTIFEAMYWVDSTDDIEQAGQDAEHLADGVLAYLGQLDPDADPELIALHLRDSRKEVERLRLRQEARFVEGDRVVTTVDTSGPAGVVKAGTVGTVSEPVAVHVVFDGDDLPFLFGDGYRPLSALKKEEGVEYG